MEFPYRHKTRHCPRDRKPSGCVGLQNSHVFIHVQTDTSAWLCVHVCRSASTNSRFSVVSGPWGRGGRWINQREENDRLHSSDTVAPLASHISTGQSPKRALLLPVMMGRAEMEITCLSASPISPRFGVHGIAEVFQQATSPRAPGASRPGEPGRNPRVFQPPE